MFVSSIFISEVNTLTSVCALYKNGQKKNEFFGIHQQCQHNRLTGWFAWIHFPVSKNCWIKKTSSVYMLIWYVWYDVTRPKCMGMNRHWNGFNKRSPEKWCANTTHKFMFSHRSFSSRHSKERQHFFPRPFLVISFYLFYVFCISKSADYPT